MPPIFNDIAEVIPFTAVFPRDAVLGDASLCIMLGQMAIWTCRRRSLTLGCLTRSLLLIEGSLRGTPADFSAETRFAASAVTPRVSKPHD
jgi:hypothetical protein